MELDLVARDSESVITDEGVALRQQYSLLILHIVCGAFSINDKRMKLVPKAKDLAKKIGRQYGEGVAYVALLHRLLDPDDDEDGESLRKQTQTHASRLGKNLDEDLETVRKYLADRPKGFGRA